jgi:hypothetical protein
MKTDGDILALGICVLAGCEVESFWDPESGRMIIRTKNECGIVRDGERVIVFERKP